MPSGEWKGKRHTRYGEAPILEDVEARQRLDVPDTVPLKRGVYRPKGRKDHRVGEVVRHEFQAKRRGAWFVVEIALAHLEEPARGTVAAWCFVLGGAVGDGYFEVVRAGEGPLEGLLWELGMGHLGWSIW